MRSIFYLRLFNDSWCSLLILCVAWAMLERRWRAANLLYGLALSIKMNALLYLPALWLLQFQTLGSVGLLESAVFLPAFQVCRHHQTLLGIYSHGLRATTFTRSLLPYHSGRITSTTWREHFNLPASFNTDGP
jgi:hypothetical protein